ncbi:MULTISPECIES: L,D-transpeptidase family protein [Bacillus]|uniref:L,D-transpeptidase family protein n=1 Tax=Bacillus TaxID=1386 RepID=UPI000468E084|nr:MULTISPECIES: L,D-transpeptidase family protein [Bacillus]MED1412751.1 L,D-transpeptidase family protein [Bacillus paramycoides]MED1466509.1 L,D-transpeptidase family protein [Bacillus paramycoides]MED1495909.1 L,D-transpeptidase family protein [Bacillus paramycoides]
MNNNTINESVEEIDKKRVRSSKRFTNWKLIAAGGGIIALLIGGMSYYQATHFNSNVTINDTKVDGLTADQAIQKLNTSGLENKVYVGQQQILDEKDTQMELTEKELSQVKKLLKSQWTFFPSSKETNYSLLPEKADQYRSETLRKIVEEKLVSMNKKLKAPQDAMAKLEQGKVVISKSVDGKQYDVTSLLKDYDKQKYKSEIHLKSAYIQPIKEDNPIVKKEEQALQELLQQSVDYKVQNEVYPLKAKDLIQNASISKDMKVTIDARDIKNKIAEINNVKSTLNKDFAFKTHSGSVISVKGQGYGWALDVEKETKQVQQAFEKGEKSLSASNIHGNGWDKEGIGYETTSNNGIGDTYAEVSIAEQQIWIYKDGNLAVTTNVVTGKHSTGEDTSPGVWYVLYKRSPYTLKGSAVGKPDYSVKVDYWAPFTNSGQGFHDAGWRTNWANNAYLTGGSGGCVNLSPSIAKTVYDNLSTNEPVIVY